MERRNGRLGNGVNGQDQQDTICRVVVASIAAMLALRLCQYIRKWLAW